VLFLDGHVIWRPLSQMRVWRTQPPVHWF
jgi:hypothetical protein